MLVAAGLGNEEIAKAININRTTLDYHVHQVFSKLDFHRRSEIVDWVDRNRPARLLMSAREFHLTALIGAGFTNGEIASRFGVSERTLEVHVRSIGLKLDLQSRAQIRDWVMGPLRYDPLSRV